MRYVGHFGEEVATLGPAVIPSIDASRVLEEPAQASENSEQISSNSAPTFSTGMKQGLLGSLFPWVLGAAAIAAAGYFLYGVLGPSTATPNPLKRGYGRKSISTNIRREIRRGRSPKQAAAIAYSVARKERARRGLSTAPLKRL